MVLILFISGVENFFMVAFQKFANNGHLLTRQVVILQKKVNYISERLDTNWQQILCTSWKRLTKHESSIRFAGTGPAFEKKNVECGKILNHTWSLIRIIDFFKYKSNPFY